MKRYKGPLGAFTGKDIVNPQDYIPQGKYNPHNVRAWQIKIQLMTSSCVVFAKCMEEALDIAADEGRLQAAAYDLDPDDLIDVWEDLESHGLTPLGNYSDLYSINEIFCEETTTPFARVSREDQDHYDKLDQIRSKSLQIFGGV